MNDQEKINSSLDELTSGLLKQLVDFILQLKNEDYCKNVDILQNQSIGKHVRHILDMYFCLIKSQSSGILNYDLRERNLTIEVDKDFAITEINHLINHLSIFDFDKKIILKQCLNKFTLRTETRISRELIYNLEHALHHFAIIRIAAEENFNYVNISKNFGFSLSTIHYRETQDS